jgi:hypothetical protein
VAVAGLSFSFESHNGAPTVTVSGTDGEARVSFPTAADEVNGSDGEVRVEHQGDRSDSAASIAAESTRRSCKQTCPPRRGFYSDGRFTNTKLS